MALNLTPDYFEADRKYRQARTLEDKLAALEEMLRTIPKHKASEKKQSDIKRRISELKLARESPKKTAAVVDPYCIPPQGAGQAILIGLPNSGKSSIVGQLTKATVKVTDFPFGTPVPVPGMAFHEDVPIELVDLPPVTSEHVPGGLANLIHNTDVLLLVVDLSSASVLEDIDALLAILRQREITFSPVKADEPDDEEEALHVGPRALVIATKADLPAATENLTIVREFYQPPPELLVVSATTGEGLAEMMKRIFGMLEVVRVYAKPPGKPADRDKPFLLPAGSTVQELARMVHKEVAENLKFARVWGERAFSGQQVHGQQVLYDRDVVELHI